MKRSTITPALLILFIYLFVTALTIAYINVYVNHSNDLANTIGAGVANGGIGAGLCFILCSLFTKKCSLFAEKKDRAFARGAFALAITSGFAVHFFIFGWLA